MMRTTNPIREELKFLQLLSMNLSASYAAFDEFMKSMNLTYVFYNGRPPAPDVLARWLVYIEEKAFPLNIATAETIEEYAHLYDVPPPCMADFMDYHTKWLANHRAWKADPRVRYSYYANRNFPRQLETWTVFRLRDLALMQAKAS
jgi:hypothetical protein